MQILYYGILKHVRAFLIMFLLGLLFYFAIGFLQIYMETNLNYKLLYGLIYNFVFTTLSSSGFYFLINIVYIKLPVKVLLLILCEMIIILLFLEVYRFPPTPFLLGQSNNNTYLI